jgi:hypothetical protein
VDARGGTDPVERAIMKLGRNSAVSNTFEIKRQFGVVDTFGLQLSGAC